MIAKEEINREWLETTVLQNKGMDKILLEKVIRTLFLLEALSQSGIKFVFKGGTAVMLLLNKPQRFSIDIDIIVPDKSDLEGAFDHIIKTGLFSRYELQVRHAQSDIQKSHYKFYYSPLFKTLQTEESILLDILHEKIQYNTIKKIEAALPFMPHKGENIYVSVPDINNLLADKLTAFAPSTTGIPYIKNNNSMSLEIIKQLYDIGSLFSLADNIPQISLVFAAFVQTELRYRNMNSSIDKVLDDIYLTSLCLSSRGKLGKGDFNALQTGIKRASSYIFSEKYQIEKAIVHASRIAYLATLIKNKEDKIARYQNAAEVIELNIRHPELKTLNKLKKTNPEAFFYWFNTSEIIGEGRA